MKCPDLHRNLMFADPGASLGGGDVNLLKYFCKKLHEISRSVFCADLDILCNC